MSSLFCSSGSDRAISAAGGTLLVHDAALVAGEWQLSPSLNYDA